MIHLKLEGTDEVVNLPENWSEVTLKKGLEIARLQEQAIDNDSEFAAKFFATVADDKDKCLRWIGQMTLSEFSDVCSQILAAMDFNEIPKVDPAEFSDKEPFIIEGRTYKLIKDFNSMTLDEIKHFETLKAKYKDQYDKVIAFALLLREMDENGGLKDFTVEAFEYAANNLIDKVVYADVIPQLGFFFLGGKKSSAQTMPRFSVSITK